MTRGDRPTGEPVGQASTGFSAPSAYKTAEVHLPGLPSSRFVPLSAFLTPSGVYSLRCRTGLFHPAAAPGVLVYRALLRPEIRYLFRGPILPCRYRTTRHAPHTNAWSWRVHRRPVPARRPTLASEEARQPGVGGSASKGHPLRPAFPRQRPGGHRSRTCPPDVALSSEAFTPFARTPASRCLPS